MISPAVSETTATEAQRNTSLICDADSGTPVSSFYHSAAEHSLSSTRIQSNHSLPAVSGSYVVTGDTAAATCDRTDAPTASSIASTATTNVLSTGTTEEAAESSVGNSWSSHDDFAGVETSAKARCVIL